MTYWEAGSHNPKAIRMVHASKRCRQLRKVNVIRKVESTVGRVRCGVCAPVLDLAEMRRIAFDDLRVVVREVMGEDAAAAVLARLEG